VVVPFAKTGIMGSIFLASLAPSARPWRHHVIGNTPTSAVAFSPGYSMRGDANEFTEATGGPLFAGAH